MASVETQSVKIDGDSLELATSTKGIVSPTVKRYTDFTTGASGVKAAFTDEFWTEVVRQGKKAKEAFYAINPEMRA